MRIRARRIVSGTASGTALVSPAPFSFVGGADPANGEILDEATEALGESLRGRIFAFPRGKGSTVGSYVLYGLAKRNAAPAALINKTAEAIIAIGATLAKIPMVDRVDTSALRSGDRIVVDAVRGHVDLPDVRAAPVVSAILRHRGRILIVRRSEAVGSFRGRWSAISGFMEGRESPRERAVREVREETGLRSLKLRDTGPPIFARDASTIYVVHPFLFDTASRRVRLDWENVELRWIRPEELARYRTVPRLREVMEAVLPNGGRGVTRP